MLCMQSLQSLLVYLVLGTSCYNALSSKRVLNLVIVVEGHLSVGMP